MMGMNGPPPFSGVTNFLFGFQQLVFSLSQVMQIVGMNTQAVSNMVQLSIHMFDSAYQTFKDLKKVNNDSLLLSDNDLTEEEKKRRRRLKVLRWSLFIGVTYTMYKTVYSIISWIRRRGKRQPRLTTRYHHSNNYNDHSSAMTRYSPYNTFSNPYIDSYSSHG